MWIAFASRRCETNTSILAYIEIGASEKGIVEARVEALMDNLAMAVMQADNLAADSPEYGVLAETLAYALDQIPRPRVATTR